MTFFGADVDQLRALAKAADKAATLLSTKAASLQGQIMAAPWKGNDAERFKHDWTGSHRPSLDKVVESLRQNSRILLKHADEQEKASDRGTGGTSMTFAEKAQEKIDAAREWLAERAKEAAEREEHRKELTEGAEKMLKASPEEQAKWWNSLSDEDKKYLLNNEETAKQIMEMDGGVPDSAQAEARKYLHEQAKADIPVYKETGKAAIEARVAWVHGGAEVGTEIVQNADGSATMKVHGKLGLGVNDPSGTAGATLSGEVSREYTFDSVEEAKAAQAQMFRELPPDSIGDVKDVASNPPDYILDRINDAAEDNGADGHVDKAKGTLSLEASGKAGTDAEGGVKLDLSYEKNLSDGTSKASGEVSASGQLDLDGQRFEASGKGGLEVNMNKDNNIDSVSLSLEGTVATGAVDGVEAKGVGSAESSITAGTQGTVKIDIDYTPENKEIIDSYMRNVATGNTAAAASDAAKLYDHGSATVQVNNVVTAKNEAGVDLKAGEVKVSTENQVTTNVTTYHKVENDTKLEKL
ncbi:hypothetical protein [Arthrobacter silvisoli]|uniref:hypothetical protein n=1 Tax=Arthrobacter silvisoli TaxID=2291022 RepID=UPI000E20D6C3|nr:hypothetical protein [Arthrobacter silvisoli]